MAVQGTIVSSWQDGTCAYMAVRVGTVEYIGEAPLAVIESLDAAGQKAALLEAVRAVHDAQAVTMTNLDFTGPVTL